MSKLRKFSVPVRAAKPADSNLVSRICGLADGGEIEKAGEEAAALLARGAYGVSPFAVWLAASFAETGPALLPTLLRHVAAQIAADETTRPAMSSEWRQAFTWFVDNVRSRVRFHAKFHDQTWTRWCAALTSSLEHDLEQAGDELTSATADAARDEVTAGVTDLCALVHRNFGSLLPTPEPEADEPEAEMKARSSAQEHDEFESSDDADELDEFDDGGDIDADDEAEEPAFVGLMEPRVRVGTLTARTPDAAPGSMPLRALQAKLSAFERLAGEQSWPLAAMVARDIERELSQFDPVRYFPQYFSNYLNTLCEVGAELEMHMQPADSLESQALERLYHADPERFLAQLGAGGVRTS